MSVSIEEQTTVDVADLMTQFLSAVPDAAQDVQSAVDRDGIVLCSVVVAGLRYTLSCQPCDEENAPAFLSPREQEVVRLVMKGFSTRGIAQLLDISPWTVSTHLRRIFLKLNVSSRAEMVAQVLREGILIGASG
jgi:DNA-binding NarL/FixJ family response regulator